MTDVVQRELKIVNKLGLHARAAAKFVSLAARFESEVLVRREDREVNAKSIMGVMMLAAAKDSMIEIEARGVDASDAVAQLEELINDRFGEDE